MLLVMRPYQITATERILNRIEIANNYRKYGSIAAGGYIWHTTGSGKTLAYVLPMLRHVQSRLAGIKLNKGGTNTNYKLKNE